MISASPVCDNCLHAQSDHAGGTGACSFYGVPHNRQLFHCECSAYSRLSSDALAQNTGGGAATTGAPRFVAQGRYLIDTSHPRYISMAPPSVAPARVDYYNAHPAEADRGEAGSWWTPGLPPTTTPRFVVQDAYVIDTLYTRHIYIHRPEAAVAIAARLNAVGPDTRTDNKLWTDGLPSTPDAAPIPGDPPVAPRYVMAQDQDRDAGTLRERGQWNPLANRRSMVGFLLAVAAAGVLIWFLASGYNCYNGPVDSTGHYERTCTGPDFGHDPNQP